MKLMNSNLEILIVFGLHTVVFLVIYHRMAPKVNICWPGEIVFGSKLSIR